MGISITQLIQDRRPLAIPMTIDGQDETLNVVYSPSGYTAAIETDIEEARGQQLKQARLAVSLASGLLVSWDLTQPKLGPDGAPVPLLDTKGKPVLRADGTPEVEQEPYPITPAALSRLSTPFLNLVVYSITADLKAPAEDEKNSVAG